MKKRNILLLSGLILLPLLAQAQVMRSQVYEPFMKAQLLQRRGQDSAAIACLNELAELVPTFPPVYLRQADIYYEMYQRNGSKEALQGAVFMYRKYLTLEFNENLIKEPSERLRKLEDILQVSHFEEDELKESLASNTETIQVITDQTSADKIVESQPEAKAIELVPLVAVAKENTVSEPVSRPNSSLIPDLGNPSFSFLSYYKLNPPTVPNKEEPAVPQLAAKDMNGHWVSDMMLGDGREQWIFDFKEDGNNDLLITFSNHSGIVNEDVDDSTPFRRALVVTKSYLQKTNILSDTKYEVLNERVRTKVDPSGFTFKIEVDKNYIAGNALFKWGKSLVNNLSGVIPFGPSISNYVNNYVEQKEIIDRTKNATIVYTFNCKSKAPGVLSCDITSMSNFVDEKGRNKSKAGSSFTCSLFKTENGYTFGNNEVMDEEHENLDELFEKVKQDAAKDVNYNYPLAILYFNGIGTKQDEGKAVECMNLLGLNRSDARAKAWLASYFYHKAYADDVFNIILRRKYIKSAQFWSSLMKSQKHKEWYGVKGDMCISDQQRDINTTMQDSALYYYKKGDEAGDVYSTYRLGYMYLHNEKPNLQEAQRLLLKAANAGNEDAIYELALSALVAKDLDAYIHNLHLSADMGCPEAFDEIAKAYSMGSSRGFKVNPVEGTKMKRFAKQAAKDDWMSVLLSYGYKLDSYL